MAVPVGATTIPEPHVVEEMSRLYRFRGPDVVPALQREDSAVIALMRETSDHIQRWFGEGTETVLEYAFDMDDDDPGQFYAWVQTPLEPEEVRPTMDQFRKHWLISVWSRSQGRFNVGLEYR